LEDDEDESEDDSDEDVESDDGEGGCSSGCCLAQTCQEQDQRLRDLQQDEETLDAELVDNGVNVVVDRDDTDRCSDEGAVNVGDRVGTGSAESIIDGAKDAAEVGGIITDRVENITEESENITDRSDIITDRSEIITDRSEIITDRSEIITDRSEIITDRSENITDRVDGDTLATENSIDGDTECGESKICDSGSEVTPITSEDIDSGVQVNDSNVVEVVNGPEVLQKISVDSEH
jgi:hypothetical protein